MARHPAMMRGWASIVLALLCGTSAADAQTAAAGPVASTQPHASGPVSPPVPAPAKQKGPEIGYLTAARLAAQCNDSNGAQVSYCFAYIAGVHDTMRAYEIWLGQKEFCIPFNIAQGDLRRAFLTYLLAYPADRNGQASSVVAMALRQTYPCAIGAK